MAKPSAVTRLTAEPAGTSPYESLRVAMRGSLYPSEPSDSFTNQNLIAPSATCIATNIKPTPLAQVPELENTFGFEGMADGGFAAGLFPRTALIPRLAAVRGATMNGDQEVRVQQNDQMDRGLQERTNRHPIEDRLTKAGDYNGDVRRLPYQRPVRRERRELEEPAPNPGLYLPAGIPPQSQGPSEQSAAGPAIVPQLAAPAPPPLNVFDGLDRFNWGAGSPPDTNGDVGPNHYIQTVNTSIGIFRKTDGFMEAAFTFDTFMSQGHFGNLCDTNNFGDPVVLYDTFEDRWIITDFAFLLDAGNNVVSPAYQCIAASKSGDPISGGWNFYSRQMSDT